MANNQVDWFYTVDDFEPFTLMVGIYDPETDWDVGGPFLIDALSGIDAPFDVSDHGNVNVSPETEKYLQTIADELATDNNSRLI